MQPEKRYEVELAPLVRNPRLHVGEDELTDSDESMASDDSLEPLVGVNHTDNPCQDGDIEIQRKRTLTNVCPYILGQYRQ